MSTATIDATPASLSTRAGVHSQPVTFARAAKSEWIKFRSLRSSWAVLGGAVLGVLAIGLVVAYNTRHVSANQDPVDLAASATLQGYLLGELLIGALGVLFVSSEFSTGMIRSTLAAVPKRLPVLWSKLAVFAAVAALAMTAITVVTFVSAQALIGHYRTGYSLSDSGVWRIVLGTGLYLTLVGVLGGMIGWLVRSTPGALVTFFGLFLVLPVFGSIFGSVGKDVAQFLPSKAGAAFISSNPESPSLSAGAGLLVLVAWVAAGIILAAVSLRRRDA
ncbi:MAG: ABC transporter permease subunit [Actinomycetota bacterium]|nr:ABC transporter permease subunit [Actinomycetota bacterium]